MEYLDLIQLLYNFVIVPKNYYYHRSSHSLKSKVFESLYWRTETEEIRETGFSYRTQPISMRQNGRVAVSKAGAVVKLRTEQSEDGLLSSQEPVPGRT